MKKKKDILMNNTAFQELCMIVYERNIICRSRTSIRNKLYRLNTIRRNIQHNNEVTNANKKNKTLTNRLTKFEQRVHELNHLSITPLYLTDKIVANRRSTLNAIKECQKIANKELLYIPKKYAKMSISELILQTAYLERDMAQITVDQYEFTSRTRNILAKLNKTYNIKIKRDKYYDRINFVEINGNRVFAKELEQKAIDAIFEKEMFQ